MLVFKNSPLVRLGIFSSRVQIRTENKAVFSGSACGEKAIQPNGPLHMLPGKQHCLFCQNELINLE